MENPCNPRPSDHCVVYPSPGVDLTVEPYIGSFQRLLFENTGKYASVEIMLNTCEMRTVSGIIESVSGRYAALRNPKTNCLVVCDAWAIKTITFPC